MAYSTANGPYLIVGGLGDGAQSTIGQSTACTGFATAAGGTRLWGYTSSDPVATVTGSSYFTDGYNRGMRLGDVLFIRDTGQGSTIGLSIAVVTAVTTSFSSGYAGVTAIAGALHTT
jgi:hypothetical protein